MVDGNHLRQLEARNCTKIRGSVILRCEARCESVARRAYGLLGADFEKRTNGELLTEALLESAIDQVCLLSGRGVPQLAGLIADIQATDCMLLASLSPPLLDPARCAMSAQELASLDFTGHSAPEYRGDGCVISAKQNKDKPTSLTFRYTSGGGVNSNDQGSKVYGDVTATWPSGGALVFNGRQIPVTDGATFIVSGYGGGKFSAWSSFSLGGKTVTFHTSGSVDLRVGDRYGPLTLLGGGVLGGGGCPAAPPTPPPTAPPNPTAADFLENYEYRVRSLAALRGIKKVSGIVEVSRCTDLERLDGGFGSLTQLGHARSSVSSTRSLRFIDNTKLRGVAQKMLPSLHPTHPVGVFAGNADLCVDEDPRFETFDNRAQERCDCAQYPEHCDLAQCSDCVSGTHGECYLPTADGAKVCVPHRTTDTIVAEECPYLAGLGLTEQCDLCEGVKCNDPPPCFHTAGICLTTSGTCSYTNPMAENTVCDDGDELTGPDLCDAKGHCGTTAECVVAEILGVVGYGEHSGAIRTKRQLEQFAHCGTIKGSLNIDCDPDTDDVISSLAPLAHLVKVTGSVRIANCPAILSVANASLPKLRVILGKTRNFDTGGSTRNRFNTGATYNGLQSAEVGIRIENNVNMAGAFPALFPSLVAVRGPVRVVDNPKQCVTRRIEAIGTTSEFTAMNNANPLDCGCTDPQKRNYKPGASLDDGGCVDWPCEATGSNGVQDAEECPHTALDCRVRSCNYATNKCEFKFVVLDLEAAGNASIAPHVTCDDEDPFTVGDQCEDSGNGVVECQGRSVCDHDNMHAFCMEHSVRPGDDKCTSLECTVPDDKTSPLSAACQWSQKVNGTFCDLDARNHTIDRCAAGLCELRYIDRCFQKTEREYEALQYPFERVLYINHDATCATNISVVAGDVISFSVFDKDDLSDKLEINVMGIDIFQTDSTSGAAAAAAAAAPPVDWDAALLRLLAERGETLANWGAMTEAQRFEFVRTADPTEFGILGAPPNGLEYLPYEEVAAAWGHWELELLPSQREMGRFCAKSCLEIQLINARSKASNATSVNERYYISQCQEDEDEGCHGPVSSDLCRENTRDDLLCDRWQSDYGLCDLEEGAPAQLHVVHRNFRGEPRQTPFLRAVPEPEDGVAVGAARGSVTFRIDDHDLAAVRSSVEIINFDVRQRDHLRHALTSDDGTYGSLFVTDVPGSKNRCECQASWTSRLDGKECKRPQSGCTNCDNDARGGWCLIANPGCAEEEVGKNGQPDGWAYCNAFDATAIETQGIFIAPLAVDVITDDQGQIAGEVSWTGGLSAHSAIVAGEGEWPAIEWGPAASLENLQVVVAAPIDASAPLTADAAGAAVVVRRSGSVEFSLIAYRAQNANASAVIITDNNANVAVTVLVRGAYGNDVTIPVFLITEAAGQALEDAVAANSSTAATLTRLTRVQRVGLAKHIFERPGGDDSHPFAAHQVLHTSETLVSFLDLTTYALQGKVLLSHLRQIPSMNKVTSADMERAELSRATLAWSGAAETSSDVQVPGGSWSSIEWQDSFAGAEVAVGVPRASARPLTNTDAVRGAIAVVRHFGRFGADALRAQQAGARAVIIVRAEPAPASASQEWVDLTAGEQAAATVLGMEQTTWDANEPFSGGIEGKRWANLTGTDQVNLGALGWTENSWETKLPIAADSDSAAVTIPVFVVGYTVGNALIDAIGADRLPSDPATLVTLARLSPNDVSSCPVEGVEVCVHDAADPEQRKLQECVTTDANGGFSFAIMQGTSVLLKATKAGRSFEIYDGTATGAGRSTAPLDSGTTTPTAELTTLPPMQGPLTLNIVDITTMEVRIRYGGGSCLRPLGHAKFSFRSASGSAQCNIRQVIKTRGTSMLVRLPAQDYTATLEAVNPAVLKAAGNKLEVVAQAETEYQKAKVITLSATGIMRYFATTAKTAEVGEVFPVAEQATLERPVQFDSTDAVVVATWEYHVTPNVELSCPSCELPGCYEGRGGDDAVMVMDSGKSYAVDIALSEVFYLDSGDKDIECSVVPGSINFQESASTEQSDSIDALTVTLNEDGSAIGSGKVSKTITAGGAKTVAPYAKEVRVTYQEHHVPSGGGGWHMVTSKAGRGRAKAYVVIRGESGGDSEGMDAFKVPEYLPLTILRRPPGDGSSATISTGFTASVQMDLETEEETISPVQHSLSVTLAGKNELTNGAGGGAAGPLVATSEEIAQVDSVLFNGGFGYTAKIDTRPLRKGMHVEVELTQSITTPADKLFTGHAGDVYLSAALSVRFVKVTHVDVKDQGSSERCAVNAVETTQWFFARSSEDDLTQDEDAALTEVVNSHIVSDPKIRTAEALFNGDPDGLDNVGWDRDADSLRRHVKENYLNGIYSDPGNRWNAFTVYTTAEIVRDQIPELIGQREAAIKAIDCIDDYDPETCPSLDIMRGEQYGTRAVHAMRKKVAEAGVKGWQNMLQTSRKLEEEAYGDPKYALQPGEIWSSDMSGDKSLDHHVTLLVDSMFDADYAEQNMDVPPRETGVNALLKPTEGSPLQGDIFVAQKEKVKFVTKIAKYTTLAFDLSTLLLGLVRAVKDRAANGIKAAAEAQQAEAKKQLAKKAEFQKAAGEISQRQGVWLGSVQKEIAESGLDATAKKLQDLGGRLGAGSGSIVEKTKKLLKGKTADSVKDLARNLQKLAADGPKWGDEAISEAGQKAAKKAALVTGVKQVKTILSRLNKQRANFLYQGTPSILGAYAQAVLSAFNELQGSTLHNGISFSGGATYEYEFSQYHSSYEGEDEDHSIDVGASMKDSDEFNIMRVGLQFDTDNEMKYRLFAHKAETSNKMKSSSIKFALNDGDAQDRFDVVVYKDPVYETPIFKTVSGRSRCPHEAGTLPLDKVDIKFDGGFNKYTANIPPDRDDSTTIPVFLRNNGYQSHLQFTDFTDAAKPHVQVSFADHGVDVAIAGADISEIMAGEGGTSPGTRVLNMRINRPDAERADPHGPDDGPPPDKVITYPNLLLEHWAKCEYDIFVTGRGLSFKNEAEMFPKGILTSKEYSEWRKKAELGYRKGTLNFSVTVEPRASGRRQRALPGGGAKGPRGRRKDGFDPDEQAAAGVQEAVSEALRLQGERSEERIVQIEAEAEQAESRVLLMELLRSAALVGALIVAFRWGAKAGLTWRPAAARKRARRHGRELSVGRQRGIRWPKSRALGNIATMVALSTAVLLAGVAPCTASDEGHPDTVLQRILEHTYDDVEPGPEPAPPPPLAKASTQPAPDSASAAEQLDTASAPATQPPRLSSQQVAQRKGSSTPRPRPRHRRKGKGGGAGGGGGGGGGGPFGTRAGVSAPGCRWAAYARAMRCTGGPGAPGPLNEVPTNGVAPGTRLFDLRYNRIGGVVDESFRTLRALEVVDLSYNPIQKISAGAFENNPSLRSISLAHTMLKALPDTLLRGLGDLVKFGAAHTSVGRGCGNQLSRVFSRAPKLVQIRLEDVKLTAVASAMFGSLQELRDLKLGSNPVQTIANDSFAGMLILDTPAAADKLIGQDKHSLGQLHRSIAMSYASPSRCYLDYAASELECSCSAESEAISHPRTGHTVACEANGPPPTSAKCCATLDQNECHGAQQRGECTSLAGACRGLVSAAERASYCAPLGQPACESAKGRGECVSLGGACRGSVPATERESYCTPLGKYACEVAKGRGECVTLGGVCRGSVTMKERDSHCRALDPFGCKDAESGGECFALGKMQCYGSIWTVTGAEREGYCRGLDTYSCKRAAERGECVAVGGECYGSSATAPAFQWGLTAPPPPPALGGGGGGGGGASKKGKANKKGKGGKDSKHGDGGGKGSKKHGKNSKLGKLGHHEAGAKKAKAKAPAKTSQDTKHVDTKKGKVKKARLAASRLATGGAIASWFVIVVAAAVVFSIAVGTRRRAKPGPLLPSTHTATSLLDLLRHPSTQPAGGRRRAAASPLAPRTPPRPAMGADGPATENEFSPILA